MISIYMVCSKEIMLRENEASFVLTNKVKYRLRATSVMSGYTQHIQHIQHIRIQQKSIILIK